MLGWLLKQEIHELHGQGVAIQTIAARLGLDRKTVLRYIQAPSPEALITIRPGRPGMIDQYAAYLRDRWEQGCDNAELLCREITQRGYRGGRRTVRRFLNSLAERHGHRVPAEAPPPVADVVRWIVGRPERRSEEARDRLKDLCERCPHIAETTRLARDFCLILRRREGHRLREWLRVVFESNATEVRSFAKGLEADFSAVQAGLSTSWSSGAVEGHVNRVKMLKRQHFGCAGFDLLRRRILLAS
ncbi:transposase [Streptomyces violascens]|uniref:transposase n=1 Tax=Streptomyces violascens TaxID=67381 RepID=UPI00365E8719